MADEKALGLDLKGDSPERRSYDAPRIDPEMEGLTLYEKKALLVNRELDSHGMGKYQVKSFQECEDIRQMTGNSGISSSCAASAT